MSTTTARIIGVATVAPVAAGTVAVPGLTVGPETTGIVTVTVSCQHGILSIASHQPGPSITLTSVLPTVINGWLETLTYTPDDPGEPDSIVVDVWYRTTQAMTV